MLNSPLKVLHSSLNSYIKRIHKHAIRRITNIHTIHDTTILPYLDIKSHTNSVTWFIIQFKWITPYLFFKIKFIFKWDSRFGTSSFHVVVSLNLCRELQNLSCESLPSEHQLRWTYSSNRMWCWLVHHQIHVRVQCILPGRFLTLRNSCPFHKGSTLPFNLPISLWS